MFFALVELIAHIFRQIFNYRPFLVLKFSIQPPNQTIMFGTMVDGVISVIGAGGGGGGVTRARLGRDQEVVIYVVKVGSCPECTG